MSREAIVEKILSDAQLKAEAMVGEAQDKAHTILADVAEQSKQYLAKSQSETDRLVADIISRSKTVAELDSKKLMQAAKSVILERVFARALEKVRELDVNTYKELLLGMLKEAQDGDTVTLSKRDKNVLSADDIRAFADERGISLCVSDEDGDFDGGLILSRDGVDKNLTFEVEIDLLRDIAEADIAKEIFG